MDSSVSAQSLAIRRLKRVYELSMTLSGDPMDIFVHVASMIAELLAVKVVCLSEIHGSQLHFLSVYSNGEVVSNAGQCPLGITPCATVEESKDIRIYDRVAERFPHATFLEAHNAYAYCGFPSLDHVGNVVAVTCLLDDQPHEFSVEDQELLRIVGQRIGLEMARKRASEAHAETHRALQENQARFLDVAEAACEFIWEVDTEGRFTYLTDRVVDMYGLTPSELLGKAPFEFLLVDDIEWVRDFFHTLIRDKRPFRDLEHRVRSRTGDITWISVSGVPMLDESGDLRGFRGTTANITARKEAELARQQSEEQFRIIAETISEVFWMADTPLTKIRYVSPAYERIWQRPCQELYENPQSFTDCIHPDDRDNARAHFIHQANQQPFELEYRIVRQDGSTAWIWDRSFPLIDGTGQVTGCVGIAQDITTRKEAEIRLRESEQRLELALQGAELGLWDWYVPSGAVFFNDRWIEMLGYAREELEPRYEQWVKLVHPDDLVRVTPVLEAHLAGHTAHYEIEHRLLTKDGTWKWVWSSGKVLARDAAGRPLRAAGTHLDISERKELEERLREQHAQLAHAQRLTTAGELAAIIVHELNQPLGAISSYVGAAQLEFADLLNANPSLREILTETLRLTHRASGIVRSIRDLVRQHDHQSVPLNLGAILEESFAYVQREFDSRQIRSAIDVPCSLPAVRGDRIQLQQLFLNLFLNAMDAMSEVDGRTRQLTVRVAVVAGNILKVSIIDTGPGIASNVIPRVFEPFVTNKTNGIGLGLSLCRSIAEAHGGRIRAHSVQGQGACFEVLLPAVTGEATSVH